MNVPDDALNLRQNLTARHVPIHFSRFDIHIDSTVQKITHVVHHELVSSLHTRRWLHRFLRKQGSAQVQHNEPHKGRGHTA